MRSPFTLKLRRLGGFEQGRDGPDSWSRSAHEHRHDPSAAQRHWTKVTTRAKVRGNDRLTVLTFPPAPRLKPAALVVGGVVADVEDCLQEVQQKVVRKTWFRQTASLNLCWYIRSGSDAVGDVGRHRAGPHPGQSTAHHHRPHYQWERFRWRRLTR